MPTDDKVGCRTPNPDKPGVTNVPRWKFDCLRSAILGALNEGDLPFSDLVDAVRPRLSEDQIARMGSLGWHTTTVKLELEVRNEIARLPGVTPQRLTLADGRE